MRNLPYVALLASLLALGAGMVFSSSSQPAELSKTVEINLAEVSPKGEAGGFAIPASGSSYGCTMYGMPTSMTQGETFWLYYSPNIAMNVTRNGVSLGTAASSPWSDGTSASLGPGVYTYQLSGTFPAGTHCTNWEQSCSGDTKSGYSCSNVCVATDTFYDSYSCSGALTVNAPSQPDLTSSNLDLVGGGASIPVNTSVSFTARTNNVSVIGAAGFNDVFRYNGVAFSSSPHPEGLGPNSSYTNNSATITFATPGVITIEHCSDSNSQVAESNESNNCSQRTYTVTSEPSPTSVAASCAASPNPAARNESVTWTATASGGTAPYTYQWTGSDGLSGSGVSVSHSYAVVGTKTAQVQVTDVYGITSGLVNCESLTVAAEPPPPPPPWEPTCSGDLQGRIIGSGDDWDHYTYGDPLVISGNQQIELEWSTSRLAAYTSSPTFETGGALSGTNSSVSEPAPGQSFAHELQTWCEGGGGVSTDTLYVENSDAVSRTPTLDADPNRVRQGESTTLRVVMPLLLQGQAPSCFLHGRQVDPGDTDGWGGFSNNGEDDLLIEFQGLVYHEYETGPIYGETEFFLYCDNGQDSDTVRVLPVLEHF